MLRARAALAPFTNAGVAAVILRAFLGGTMLYAGLDTVILDPRFLQPDGVGSITVSVAADGSVTYSR